MLRSRKATGKEKYVVEEIIFSFFLTLCSMLVFRLFGFGLLVTHPAQEKPVILRVTSFFFKWEGKTRESAKNFYLSGGGLRRSPLHLERVSAA